MPPLDEDCRRLATAIEACRGRVDPDVVGQADAVLRRVGHRLSMSSDATVVALVGATGSGKSTLFNALTRTALAEPGVRRPMTGDAMAATFGEVDTTALLDWLGIARRHVIPAQDLGGVLLIDLPDFDSVVGSHRAIVERLLEVVDEFMWVVDPQKYADAALHERYLRRFSGHSDVMTVVVNQVDRLSPAQVSDLHADLLRLLRVDGLANPQVFDVSALTGAGMEALRRYLARVAATKASIVARLEADVGAQAVALGRQVGLARTPLLGSDDERELTVACLQAAGVDQIGDAVRRSVTRRGWLATGWPVLTWITRLRSDPLHRLHLDRFWSGGKDEPAALTRSSIGIHPVAQARIATAIRKLGDDATTGLPDAWRASVERVLKAQSARLPDAVDQAVLSADVHLERGHRWWGVVKVCQRVLLVLAILALVWLAVNFVVVSFLGLPALPTPVYGRLGLPTWVFLGAILLGLLLAGAARLAVAAGAKVAAVAARKQVRQAVGAVVTAAVIVPINAELQRRDDARVALAGIVR